jgi:pyroglutamyl-peptidase
MTTAPAVVLLAALALLASAADAQITAVTAQPGIVVSGFEPFGGRAENASWTLAGEIARAFPKEVRAVQIPVVWGAPLTAIHQIQPLPKAWIAFGEGTPVFQIEILAHNQRGQFADNNGTTPAAPEVVSAGAPELKQQEQVADLAAALTQAGFPTRVSQNAGRYLCEEMLYSLLHEQKQHPDALKLVLFIHVPVLGQSVQIGPAQADSGPRWQKVDAAWLEAFGRHLWTELRRKGLLAETAAGPLKLPLSTKPAANKGS